MNYSETDVETIFDDYANYYNDSGRSVKDHISVLAEFSSIGQALEHNANEMELSIEESFRTLYITIELLSKGYTREEFSQLNLETILKGLEDLSNRKGTIIGSYLSNDVTFDDITSLNDQINSFVENYVVNPEELQVNQSISTIERILSKIRHVSTHMIAVGMLKYKIIEEYYPSELPIYSELSEDDKAKLRHNSNADKLHIAKDWLHPIIKAISTLEDPTHEMVLEIIQKEFPEFKFIPGEENLSFIKGLNNINKSSIDKALRYLFNKKYDDNIAKGTIRRKYNDYGMW